MKTKVMNGLQRMKHAKKEWKLQKQPNKVIFFLLHSIQFFIIIILTLTDKASDLCTSFRN